MPFVLFIIIGVLALIGLASILGSIAWVGALVFLPVLMFKVLFLFLLFGLISRGLRSRRWNAPRWQDWDRHPQRERDPAPSAEERFEEWHRTAHAREEVDSWVEGLDPESE